MTEQESAYDKELEIFTKTKEKEIKMLEETISSTEKLYRLAIDRISNNWESLYGDLIDWNYQAGSTIEKDLISAWNNASLAVQKYGDYLTAVTKLQEQLNSSTSGVYSTVSNTADHDTTPSADAFKEAQIKYIIGEMKANGEGWAAADRVNDEASKKKYSDANLILGEQLQGIINRTVIRGNDGAWYLDKVGGAKLYDVYKYHEGGIVGGLSGYTKINPDTEQFAKLLKGEVVSTPQQVTKFLRSTLPDMIQNVGNYGGFSIGELKTEINIQGNADESTVTQLNQMMPQITSQVTDNLVQTFRNRGIFNKGSFGQRMNL